MRKDRSGASYGDILDEIQLRHVKLIRRYGCIRRDQYEIHADAPIPNSFRAYLARIGAVRQTKTLFVLEVAGAYQLTMAPAAGRMVFIPRLALDLDSQITIILEIANALDEMLDAA